MPPMMPDVGSVHFPVSTSISDPTSPIAERRLYSSTNARLAMS